MLTHGQLYCFVLVTFEVVLKEQNTQLWLETRRKKGQIFLFPINYRVAVCSATGFALPQQEHPTPNETQFRQYIFILFSVKNQAMNA